MPKQPSFLNPSNLPKSSSFSYHFLHHKSPTLFPSCPFCSSLLPSAMARTKNLKVAPKKVVPSSSEGTPSKSAASDKAPATAHESPAPTSAGPSSSHRRIKSLARKSTQTVSPTVVSKTPVSSSPPALGDLNEAPPQEGGSIASLSNQEETVAAPVSARTRASISSPKKPKARKSAIGKSPTSKIKKQLLKENPPSASSSKSSSDPEEEVSVHEEESSEYTPENETEPEPSLPSLVETASEPAATDPLVALTPVSDKKGKSKVLSAKEKPSAVKPAQQYARKLKRSLPQTSSIPQAKKKRTTGISLDNFSPHSKYFCYNDNERDMKLYEGRSIISEKNFDVLAHKHFGVIYLLLQREWMETLDGFTGYVDRIVREFYANITEDCLDENSFMHEKVFVRGSWCSFSPKDIADALHLPYPVAATEVVFDRATVFAEITGDPKIELQESMHISLLTYHNAALMRFAISNWIPCSNMVNVSNELAFFLFKLSTGVPIDLAETIHEQIMSFRRGKKPKQNLIFPHLIYKIISTQHELMLDNEALEGPSRGLTFKIIERTSSSKGSKKGGKLDNSDDPDNSPAAASSHPVATEVAALTIRMSRLEIGQGQILRKLEVISEKLDNISV